MTAWMLDLWILIMMVTWKRKVLWQATFSHFLIVSSIGKWLYSRESLSTTKAEYMLATYNKGSYLVKRFAWQFGFATKWDFYVLQYLKCYTLTKNLLWQINQHTWWFTHLFAFKHCLDFIRVCNLWLLLRTLVEEMEEFHLWAKIQFNLRWRFVKVVFKLAHLLPSPSVNRTVNPIIEFG